MSAKERVKAGCSKVFSWTGLAVTVVVTGIAAALIYNRSGKNSASDTEASDTV